MSFRLKVNFPIPAEDDALGWAAGFWKYGCTIYATWKDNEPVGWVVVAGAEKYGREIIDPLGMTWEIEEYVQGS